ncbi:MAG: transposase [Elusimicrobia bacterium]|nr:transposase [Elusimicrobiota bacterium]
MGRKPRVHFEGARYHVTLRGNGKRTLFPDQEAFEYFLKLLAERLPRFECILHVYCLMTNHVHLVIEVGTIPLGRLIHSLEPAYARYFHKRFGTVGHLFYRPHGAKLCDRDEYLLTLLKYIHNNPIRAGMVAKPEEWPYSSARAYAGAPDPIVTTSLCMSLLSGQDSDPERYAEFMLAEPKSVISETPRLKVDLAALLAEAAGSGAVSPDQIVGAGRHKIVVDARRAFVRSAVEAGGKMMDIAGLLNRSPSSVSRLLRSG